MSSAESETKTRILEASLRLLKEKRGKNVRLEDVAKAAKVSRQAVYLHFKSRIGLMVATVQYGDEVLEAQKQVAPWREATGVAKLDTWMFVLGKLHPADIWRRQKHCRLLKNRMRRRLPLGEDRMEDVRRSCRATVESLAAEGDLAAGWERDSGYRYALGSPIDFQLGNADRARRLVKQEVCEANAGGRKKDARRQRAMILFSALIPLLLRWPRSNDSTLQAPCSLDVV